MDRYPNDLLVTPDDFRRSGWKEALVGRDRDGYPALSRALSAAARKLIDEGRLAEGKALWLLADACSMMLRPSSTNEPLRPLMVYEGNRSAIPEDFIQADLDFLSQTMDEVDHVWLRARIADLLWLLRKPRDPKFALRAIDAYSAIPLEAKVWTRGGHECWERAIRLARMLKADDRLGALETQLLAVFDAVGQDEGFLALWLADLLDQQRLAQPKATDIATKLETLASAFEINGDIHRARPYFEGAIRWYQRLEDSAKIAEISVRSAETWVNEAAARMASAQPSHMVANGFLEKAIQKYRAIPKALRAAHRADERIIELHAHMAAAGKASLEEMSLIESPGVDVAQLVERARTAVRGKEPLEALKAFANLYSGPQAAAVRSSAETLLRDHPLQALFGSTHFSSDGRVVARRPPMSFSSGPSEENETVIWSEMVKNHGITINLVVQAEVWPALQVMALEHRFRETDFAAIASASPIVPPGRESLFAKAFFAGYERDFAAALHFLVPQVENLVRHHLKARGAKTATLDPQGIETENGFSALMELPDAKTAFGDNLAFELKMLFCDRYGPNLRNDLAHGLLDEGMSSTVYSVYAWWLTLKLVFNTFWNARQAPQGGKDRS